MPKHVFVVFTNAKPGQDDAFNEWYTGVHVHEVAAIDGFASAQRFVLSDTSPPQDKPHRYLAIYEIDAQTVDEARAALDVARPGLQMTDAMEQPAFTAYYTAITERVVAG